MKFETGLVIAAVKTEEEITAAQRSAVKVIFCLSSNVMTVSALAKKVHDSGKLMFVHIDLAEGIGKDRAGLEFLKSAGVDGIVSTRVNIIKNAREIGLYTVQRFFIVDSHSVDTTIDAIKSSKPDMFEIMPGTMAKMIGRLKERTDIPIIAGGLIETNGEVTSAINAGAAAVSTSRELLWKQFAE